MSYNVIPMYQLKSVRERGVRYPRSTCSNENDAVSILQTYLWEKDCEHLVSLLLDGQNNFIGMTLVAKGGIHGLHVGVRDVFKLALLHNAHAIIMSHNHPSGNVEPSSEDLVFTKACIQAGTNLGCPILDHIIISSGIEKGHYSFLSHGII